MLPVNRLTRSRRRGASVYVQYPRILAFGCGLNDTAFGRNQITYPYNARKKTTNCKLVERLTYNGLPFLQRI
jgi:hypothetical protein